MIFWQGLFIALCAFILSRGLRDGIETAVRFLLPGLFLFLVGLVIYAAISSGDGFGKATYYLFNPDFSQVTGKTFLVAVGQAFFSIGVAMRLMMAYGAYLPQNISIPRVTIVIAFADTMVALLAGLAIFPFVFQYGLQVGEGPGLVFVTLPVAFSGMQWPWLISVIFFALLVIAALTSVIALLQAVIAFLEERYEMASGRATVLASITAWVLGMASAFSFNILKDFYPLGGFDLFRDKTIFETIDYITSNIMMPAGAILMALFFAWRMPKVLVMEELKITRPAWFWVWRILAGGIAPACIAAIMISSIV